jgi:hypothetical protein
VITISSEEDSDKKHKRHKTEYRFRWVPFVLFAAN